VLESTGGLIFVLQNRDQRVRVFDARGAFVRDIGRSGAGPGETRSMGGMGLIGDTLWTINAFPSKVNFFDTEGRVLASRVIPEIKRGSEVWMANAVLSESRALFWPRPIGPRDPTRRQDLFLAGWDTTRSVRVTTVPLFPWGSIRMPTPGDNEVLVSRTALFRMGRTGPLTAAAGDAFAVADQPACESGTSLPITVYDPQGSVRARASWPCTMNDVTTRLTDSVVADLRDYFVREHKVDRSLAEREVRSQLGSLRRLPVLEGLRLAQDGSVWVTPFTTTVGAAQRWTRVLPASGARISVVVPAKHDLVGIVSSDVFWTQTLDEDGVPTIHRLRR
jgi:hypothetical protein